MTQRSSMRTMLCVTLVTALGCSADATTDGFKRGVDATSQPIRAAVRSNAAVASKLAKALAGQSGNLFYSPISIEAVSGILFAGAAGDTATQLGEFLDANDDPDALHEGLGALLADLSRQHPQYTLSVANRLWTLAGLTPSQGFVDTTSELYRAPTEQVDFAADPNAARADINAWVAKQTADKIPALLQEGQITKDTVMAVVNAIYFKADWATSFDVARTQKEPFYLADGSEVSVEMMSTPEVELRTAINGNAQWLELPYRTGDVSFLAYSRRSEFGAKNPTIPSVEELQADLADVDLDAVVASLHSSELVAQMPRFSIRSRLDLVPVFKMLGVTDLFDPARADLTNISDSRSLVVNPFIHEAAVWVDELGTVAAAATAGGVTATSAPLPVRFDHPFVFLIRDNFTGAILFSGQVADPTLGADSQ